MIIISSLMVQAVLSVLIRNYTFELPDGPTTKFENYRSIMARPKLVGQDGPQVVMYRARLGSKARAWARLEQAQALICCKPGPGSRLGLSSGSAQA